MNHREAGRGGTARQVSRSGSLRDQLRRTGPARVTWSLLAVLLVLAALVPDVPGGPSKPHRGKWSRPLISACVLSPESVVFGDFRGSVLAWRIGNGEWHHKIDLGRRFVTDTLRVSANLLLTGEGHGRIRAWKLGKKGLVKQWEETSFHDGYVSGLVPSGDGAIASCDLKGTIRAWDLKTRAVRWTVRIGSHAKAWGGAKVLIASRWIKGKNWTIEWLDWKTGKTLLRGTSPEQIHTAIHDETGIVTGCGDGRLREWKIRNGHPVFRVLATFEEAILRARWVSREKRRVVLSTGKRVMLVDLTGPSKPVELFRGKTAVTTLDADRSWIAIGMHDGEFVLIRTSQALKRFR